jgi:MFS family permease
MDNDASLRSESGETHLSTLTSQKGLRLTQALHSQAFAWFWLGQSASTLGDGAVTMALAVTIYQLTGSSLVMGLFLMAQIIPELLFTLFGGVAADRLPRRLLLLCADSGRALAVLGIAALAWLQLLQLWHLFVLAVLFGLCRSFFNPAYCAITPDLVSKEHLSSANALTELSSQVGNFLGPLLGAGFIALAGGSTSVAGTHSIVWREKKAKSVVQILLSASFTSNYVASKKAKSVRKCAQKQRLSESFFV